MTEHPMKVFILKHSIMIEPLEEPYPDDQDTPEYFEIVALYDTFAELLADSIARCGAAFRGPLISSNVGFEGHYLLCLHSPWAGMHGTPFLQMKLARGEIFVADSDVYYAQPDTLTRLDGDVLKYWYRDEHGAEIPNLEDDLRRRLCQSCRYELRSLGYSGMAIRELTPRWISAVYTRKPAEWEWAWLADTLRSVVQNFEVAAKEDGNRWFVYEALERDGGPRIYPPVENRKLILDVIDALVDDPGESRQWLVRAQSVFGHSQVRYPELESIRPLEKNEIFSSHRGVFWNGGSGGIMLGEVGGVLLHERHGEIIADVENRLRSYIIQSLAIGIEARSGCDDFFRIIEAIDDELTRTDIFELWFHDLDPLMDRVVEAVKSYT